MKTITANTEMNYAVIRSKVDAANKARSVALGNVIAGFWKRLFS